MSGPSSQSISKQNDIATQQLNLSEQEQQQSQTNYQQMQQYLQPAIKFNSAIAGGDKNAAFTAIAPMLTQLSQGTAQAKGQIMESTGPGAARDVALATNAATGANAAPALMNQTYTQALDKLANIGTGLGSFSLNQTGAALQGLGGAANTNQSVIGAQTQQKASTMSMLGSLAGGAGSVFGATDLTKLSDVRLKENIEPLMEVGGVPWYLYNLKGDAAPQIGVLAQEVATIHPEVVNVGDDHTPWSVDYSSLLTKLSLPEARSRLAA